MDDAMYDYVIPEKSCSSTFVTVSLELRMVLLS